MNPNLIRNPVSRAIERRRMQQHGAQLAAELRAAADGEHIPSQMHGLAETLAIAIRSIEGWDDPDDIGGLMVDGIDTVRQMAEAGFLWRVQHAELVTQALDAAVQILCAQDPAEKLKAWAWAQGIERRVLAKRYEPASGVESEGGEA